MAKPVPSTNSSAFKSPLRSEDPCRDYACEHVEQEKGDLPLES